MQNRRVALVNPPAARIIYGDEYELKSIIPCLGLLYMQAYTKDIVDVRVFEGEEYADFDAMIKSINDFSPEVVGVTTNTSTYPLCVEVVERTFADTYIAGGPYAAFRAEDCLDTFDAVCIGDGEVPLRQFLLGMPLEAVPGFAHRKYGTFAVNPPAPLPDLDDLPFPEHPTLTSDAYQSSPHRSLPSPWATMVTSRGCGFRCTFCLSAKGGLNDGRYRERSVANVVQELEILVGEHGVRSVQFWDDTFTMRRKRTSALTDAIKDLNISYVCNTRSDKLDDSIAHQLAASGCKGVFIGVETGDEHLLESDISKGVINAQVSAAVAACKNAGVPVTTSFIIGAINDTEETVRRTAEFALQLDADHVLFNIYTAHPGTAGYQQAVAEGLIGHYKVNLDRFRGEPVGVPTICRALSRHKLHSLKAEAYLEFHRSKKHPDLQAIDIYLEELAKISASSSQP